MPPSSIYTRSEREYPSVLAEPEYPCYFELQKVAHSGVIYALTGRPGLHVKYYRR